MGQLDDDIAGMLQEPAFEPVTLVFGTYSAPAYEDVWDKDVLPGTEKGVVVEFLALLIQTSAFPTLKIGCAVLVKGVSYTVKDRERNIQEGDGKLTRLLLMKA